MSESTSVGSIYFDLVVRGSLEKQIQEIATQGQALAQKTFSGVEKAAESMVSNITKQVSRPIEKAVTNVSQSAQKMATETGKVSLSPLEKSVQKALEQAEKTKGKVQSLEVAIQELENQKQFRIAEEVQVFSKAVEAAQANVDSLKGRIAAVNAEMTQQPSQALSRELAKLQAQLIPALQTLQIEWETLAQQLENAEKSVGETFTARQEKLYSQLASAREQLAIHNQKVAEMQSATEIAAAQQTTAAIVAEKAKQAAAQASTTDSGADPTAAVRARMQAFAGAVRADVQKMIDDSTWNKLSNFVKTFGEIAVNAFSEANGAAVSFGNVASQAFSKVGGLAGVFGGKIGMVVTIAKTAGNMISGVYTKAVSKVKETFDKAKTVISKVGTAVSKLTGRLNGAKKSAHRFGSGLREIASSALLFNGISLALRNIVSYFSETITSTDEMQKALTNLKGAAANAASPIIQVLTPALTALTNAAATALSYVSRLVTMLTGKVSNAAATAAKSAEKAASAAKKASRSLASFDQIERLGGDSDSGNSETDGDSVEPNYDFQGHSPFLESILSAIKAGQWGQIGALIAEKLNSSLAAVPWEDIQSKVKNWTQNMVDMLNGLATNVDWGLIGSTIGNGLNTLLVIIDTFFQGIDWVTLGAGLAKGLNGLLDTVDWQMLGRVLTDGFKALFELLHGFVTEFASSGGFSKLGNKIAEMLKGALGNIDWPQLVADICACIVGLFESVTAFIREIDWGVVGSTIVECLMNIDWAGILLGVLSFIGSCVEGLYELVIGIFEKLAEYCGEGFFGGIFKAFANIFSWIKKNVVTPLVDAVCNLLGIHSPSTVFAEIGQNLIEGLLNGISETWESITAFFEDVFADLKDSFSQTWDNISAGVSEATQDIYREVSAVFTNVKDRVTDIWNDISSTIKGVVNGIIGFINGMISGITSGINSVIRALNKLSFTIPDWLKHVPGASNIAGKKFGFNIQTITAPQIPYLADGGVIQQPTLAMMGEYAGARNNPEIVAPQSLMAETVAGVMEDVIDIVMSGFEAVLEEQRLTRQTVEAIEIGDEVIGRATARYNRMMAVVKGGR